MEFLAIWIGTVAASFAMEMANEFRIFKDVADAGYKIDVQRLSELQKQINPDATKITLLSMLVPIFNILDVFQRTIQYNNARPMLLDQLSVTGVLEEMSDYEKKEYAKKPTGLNALIVPLKSESRLSKATKITIKGVFGDSDVYFEMNDSLDDIVIINVTGPVSRLTADEQKKKVIETLRESLQKETESSADKDASSNKEENNINQELNKSKEDETILASTPELSISEQKLILEAFKKELLEEKDADYSTKSDKGPTLSKRKK